MKKTVLTQRPVEEGFSPLAFLVLISLSNIPEFSLAGFLALECLKNCCFPDMLTDHWNEKRGLILDVTYLGLDPGCDEGFRVSGLRIQVFRV